MWFFENTGMEAANQPEILDTIASRQAALFHPHTLNLLLTVIYSYVARSGTGALSDCPYNSNDMLKLLNQLPAFTSQSDLRSHLLAPRTKAQSLLLWLCTKYGNTFSVGTAIPGFSDSVSQLTISAQVNPERHLQFLIEMQKKKGKSTLLFHGTALDNLFSILSSGFSASSDQTLGIGVFMGAEPKTAYKYAHFKATYQPIAVHDSRYRVVEAFEGDNFISTEKFVLKQGDLVTAINTWKYECTIPSSRYGVLCDWC